MTLSISRVIPHYCGMPKHLRAKKVVMVMRAFFDESGLNPKKDKALVMAGFLGTVEQWESVSDTWEQCLNQRPKIEYFKSDEADHLDGEFWQFNHMVASRKKNALAKIIGESELQGFFVSVGHGLLAQRNPSPRKRTAGSRTYDWGFFTATLGVLQYVRDHHPQETVDFIFDERRELGQCISMFNELRELARGEMPWATVFGLAGTCIPGDDKKIPALQMGDLLAGEVSSMGNLGNPPTEAWRQLVARRGIVHISCNIPWAIPILIALQGKMKPGSKYGGPIPEEVLQRSRAERGFARLSR